MIVAVSAFGNTLDSKVNPRLGKCEIFCSLSHSNRYLQSHRQYRTFFLGGCRGRHHRFIE